MHEIRAEKIEAPDAGTKYPTCIEGERAAPPDDCGGPPGYERLLEVIKDPDDDEYEEMLEWVGKSFDPEELDVARLNKALARLR